MSASITANHISTPSAQTDWYLYLIENRLNQFYCGVTNDPNRRLRQHRGDITGGAKALKGKAPLRYVFVYRVASKATAMQAEYWLKRQTRKTKERIIAGRHPQFNDTFVGLAVTSFFCDE